MNLNLAVLTMVIQEVKKGFKINLEDTVQRG